MTKLKKWFWGMIGLFKATFKKFGDENGSLTAAAISFYALLSLLPLLLLAVAVLGYVIGSSQRSFNAVAEFFNSFMPSHSFVTDVLQGLVKSRGTIGWVGIGALLWTGSQLFVTLGTAMDGIWKVREKPGFIKSRVRAILLVFLFGILVALSIGSTTAINLLRRPGLSDVVSVIMSIVTVIVAIMFAILMFGVVYKLAPDVEVHWGSAFIGAVFAGVLWEIAKQLYQIYLTHTNFSTLYGSLGSAVILILWIYYSSVILVLGAELAYMHEHNPNR
jgi:membrane protein